jgi:hypothetical protein
MSHWAAFYKQLNAMTPDVKPMDDVIEDDDALDHWYRGYLDDTARKYAQLKAQRR